MATFAIMSGNTVTNVIVADTLEEANNLGFAIEYTKDNPAGIGWTYDKDTERFIEPVVEEVIEPVVEEEEPNA